MKKRTLIRKTPTKVTSKLKGHSQLSRGNQQTLNGFFKPANSQEVPNTGKKRVSNSISSSPKVVVIDSDTESDHSTDTRIFTPLKCSLDVVDEFSATRSILCTEDGDVIDTSDFANTSTPLSPKQVFVNHDEATSKKKLFDTVLSPVTMNLINDEDLMSNLSCLFDDLNSTPVEKLSDDRDIELKSGVYRYTVVRYEIIQLYQTLQNMFVDVKKLELKSIDSHGNDVICNLMDNWFDTEILLEQRLNIILLQPRMYPFNPITNKFTVLLDRTTDGVFVITHPDVLISGTVVAGSFFCERKTILQEMIRCKETELAKHALIGTILHEIFQQAMVLNKFDLSALEEVSRKIPTDIHFLEMFSLLELTAVDVLENINKHLPNFSQFGDKFMKQHPDGKVDIPWKSDIGGSESYVAITDVLDIEESIWSPSYGLKGKIDASIAVKIRKKNINKNQDDSVQTYRIPFELKSGKMAYARGSNEHRAQVMLYTLMMSERLCNEVPLGLLFYSQTGHLQGIVQNYQELQGILQRRNELASYLHSISSSPVPKFPSMLKEPRICSKCSYQDSCMLIHQNLEQGGELSSGLGNLFSETVGKLTSSERAYFTHWFRLIQLEGVMQSSENKVSQIWTYSSQEREALGNCFGRVIIKYIHTIATGEVEITFIRNSSVNEKLEFEDSNIAVGDSLIISYEDLSQLCVAWSSVKSISRSDLIVTARYVDMSKHQFDSSGESILFRLDKCDNYKPSAIVMMNLVALFQQNERSSHLRQLIIHRTQPRYIILSPLPTETLQMYSHLNPEQQLIIEKVLACSDYAIIQGMPGTGKTTLTACLIQVLLSRGDNILLSSYTNTALDNILLKLVESDVEFVRIGRDSSVHPSIAKYLPQNGLKNTDTIKGVTQFYDSKLLYAATCLSINNVFIQKTEFDWCIVDEASQLTQFLCLGPIMRAKRFVLVGDIHQLPPLVRSYEAKKEGYDVSLFRKLSQEHPDMILSLTSQYRMNESIMSIANHLVYQNQMQTACSEVSTGTLCLSGWAERKDGLEKWLLDCIDPDKPVVLLDTDLLETCEIEVNKRVCNELETKIIKQISATLIQLGIRSSQVGIITPYRQQVSMLDSAINSAMGEAIEISTVDRFQGRDKDCIIVSAVRNNTEGKIGELLLDRHRLNVMITRAKHKLIIVGSVLTLSYSDVFKQLIEFLQERQWVYRLHKEQVTEFN